MVAGRRAPSPPQGCWAVPSSSASPAAAPLPAEAALPSMGATPTATPPPPPPPPPPPAGFSPDGVPEGGQCCGGCSGVRRSKLRNFNWEAIPAERVLGRHNIWTAAGARRGGGLPLDLRLLEELFGQRPEPSGGALRGQPSEQVSLLDSKKILNLGIFLKQLKRPVHEIVADIRDGAGTLYGAEKLLELTKLLPDAQEVRNLVAFQGSWSRLSEAEVFSLLLVQVPSYARRLELLVLKEEFSPRLCSLQSALRILTEAARELLGCEELHDLLRLVLKAGNHMNEGGYAGSALGFRVSSLLRLPDTKTNRPGMDLLHFVALEVERKDPALLCFPSKLQHVGPASRIVTQEVLGELQRLEQRLLGAQEAPGALGLEAQLEPFLQAALAELSATQAALEGLSRATAALCDFLCEEPEGFSLPACCGVFQAFGERFRAAAQENRAREAAERRRQSQQRERQEKQKRRSIASCSAREPGLRDVELDALFLRSPPSGRRSRAPLRGLQPAAGSSPARARERAPLPLSRRHTLAALPPCLESSRPPAEPAPAPAPPAPPSSAQKAGLFGQSLEALLLPPRPPSAPQGPPSPEPPCGAHQKAPAERAEKPASPKDVSALVRFFRRLSWGGDRPPPGGPFLA